ncbi:hypothetical protein M1116_00770 [Patescibacteria group bacterium]|nr:hypothetical protein [Patescibacteria group bacterium]
MNKKEFLFLLLLAALAFTVRFIDITKLPPSPNWDEVSLGYNAYSILKTGKDEWGNYFPTIFRAYGDFKLPVYIYFSLPFISLFGLNVISVRLLSVISGALLPIGVFLLTKVAFKNNKHLPFLSSLLITFLPWSIFLSRIALEANLFLTLFVFSLYFLFSKKVSFSLILFSLCLFTYNNSRVILPFYLITLFYFRPIKLNLPFFVFIAAILLFLYQTFFATTGQSRYKLVSLIDQGTINRIEQRRQSLPPLIGKVIHNKVTYFIFYSAENYLKIIDPRYLFFSGSSNYQFNIPNFPLIYSLFIPFYAIGLFFLFKNRSWLLYWYLVSPLPSAITRDAPHTLRSSVFLVLATIITALGISIIKNKLAFPLLFVILFFYLFSFASRYQAYAVNYSWSWQYGYEEAIQFIKNNGALFKNIYITKKYGEPHEFLLFYWPIDPANYQQGPSKDWNYHADWYWIDRFQNIYFLNDWEVKSKTEDTHNSLLITSPGNYPANAILLKTIYFLDKKPAFDIVKL